jgi:hypothetical protein
MFRMTILDPYYDDKYHAYLMLEKEVIEKNQLVHIVLQC